MKSKYNLEYLDLKTLSEKSTIPVPTLRDFIKDGLPHYKFKRKTRVKPEEFIEWMKRFQKNSVDNQLDFKEFLNNTLST
jgi:hypothetical protein